MPDVTTPSLLLPVAIEGFGRTVACERSNHQTAGRAPIGRPGILALEQVRIFLAQLAHIERERLEILASGDLNPHAGRILCLFFCLSLCLGLGFRFGLFSLSFYLGLRSRFCFGCCLRLCGSLLGLPLLRLDRSEEHTSELQSLMRLSYAVFCLNKKTHITYNFHQLYTKLILL